MKQLLAAIFLFVFCASPAAGEPIVVGSKTFTESYLLAEILSQLLEDSGYEVERKFGFGGTLVCYQALVNDEIDLYPEYTGTISETILRAGPGATDIAARLAALGLQTLSPIGFNNTYAIAAGPETAQRLGLRSISDLQQHPELTLGFSHEFRDRDDGWPGLAQEYGLNMPTRGIEHGLAYRAIDDGSIDITDAYSTDGDIERYGLVILADDRGFFPRYDALVLATRTLPEAAVVQLERLAGKIDDQQMRQLNSRVVVDKQEIAVVARSYLADTGLVARQTAADDADSVWRRLMRNTVRHLQLTVIALVLACLVGVPVGILIHRSAVVSSGVLYAAGLMQTIPSIALLALMIPLFGVGMLPAIIALFLYSLLPILRNTTTALNSIDPVLRRVADGMGLTPAQQVSHVVLPLAMPNVLAGIRTAAIISIGTATLAAFIGAGGLGEPIVTGLALNDTNLILQGAIPAAVLALGTELLFELIERWLVPPHLR